MTARRPYYSIRTGKNPMSAAIDLKMLRRLFRSIYSHFVEEGYFQKHFGYECVDTGYIPGEPGHDLERAILFALRKTDVTPIHSIIDEYSEDDLFDTIGFLHDHFAKPTMREYHRWNESRWHGVEFDEQAGQVNFREEVNQILEAYKGGLEQSTSGDVLERAETGLEGLFEAANPTPDPENVEKRIRAAYTKWRRHRETWEERREAIRELADVMDFLRPKHKDVLKTKDGKGLFNIASSFSILLHNLGQKTQYDRPIWYT